MSLFNRSSPSTTSTSNVIDQTVTTSDNRAAEGNAVVGGNVSTGPGDITGSLTISTTDQGAVKGGVDLALEAIRTVGSTVAGIQSTASDTVQQAYGLANEARQSETSGAINNLLKYGVWVLIAGIVVWGITKAPKS